MPDVITDAAHPGWTLAFGLVFLLLGAACLLIKFGPKWKQWGTDWSKPIKAFGVVAALLGAANTYLGIKWLLAASGAA
ncbi:hypothetical protein N1937_02060 [Rhizobium sp. WSM4643]|uniref:hypothetical protein n=1 Tax=Rhizobium sp. WSM4643 TaxID=3138253 RepID=UPI0021A95579|nr:hypothetical protein [Rhizobium leguminosarum]UWM76057.1 hypothetical protein N1937_02060 [Rhizobium leguminosarum bv. viciae]